MANLITEKQKNTIRVDYIIRLFSVSLFLISLLGIFLLAYIIPYYIAVGKKDLKVSDQFTSVIDVENKENVGQSVTQIVNQTLDEMKAAELYSKNSITPSTYFNRIIQNKNSSIQISRLSFNVIKKGQWQFFVNGVSKNREGLVVFIEDLKSKAGFTSVESPISDFAKNSDIPFTLNIKINL